MVLFAFVLMSIGMYMLAVGVGLECGERRVTLAVCSAWAEPFDWGTLLTRAPAPTPAPVPARVEVTRCERTPAPAPAPKSRQMREYSTVDARVALREALLEEAREAARAGDLRHARSLRGRAGRITQELRLAA